MGEGEETGNVQSNFDGFRVSTMARGVITIKSHSIVHIQSRFKCAFFFPLTVFLTISFRLAMPADAGLLGPCMAARSSPVDLIGAELCSKTITDRIKSHTIAML